MIKAILALVLLGTALQAQATMVVERVATLGPSGDSASLVHMNRVVRDSRGRYYAIAAGRRRVLVFDSTGRLMRTIGSDGAKPQNLELIYDLEIGPGDSLTVTSLPPAGAAGGALTLFSPEHAFVRWAERPAGSSGGSALPNGTRVIPTPFNDDHLEPLVLFSREGFPLKRFGHGLAPEPECRRCPQFLVDASSRAIWSMQPNRAELIRWSLDAIFQERVAFTGSTWFAPWESAIPDSMIGGVPPLPRPAQLLAGDDVLWMNGIVAGPGWKARKPGKPLFAMTRIDGPNDRPITLLASDTVVSVIEAIDAKTGRVTAAHRFDDRVVMLVAPGYAWYSRDDNGRIVIDILKLTPR